MSYVLVISKIFVGIFSAGPGRTRYIRLLYLREILQYIEVWNKHSKKQGHLFCQRKTTKIDVFRHVDFCWVPLPLVAPPLLIMASQAEVNSA